MNNNNMNMSMGGMGMSGSSTMPTTTTTTHKGMTTSSTTTSGAPNINVSVNIPSVVGAVQGAFNSIFSAVSAFTASGQLHITTDKPYYVSGELITGKIEARIHQPISARSVAVRVVGYEKCEWNKKSTKQTKKPGTGENGVPAEYDTEHFIHRYRGKKTFFDATVPVYNLQDGILPPNTYVWPFQYQLVCN